MTNLNFTVNKDKCIKCGLCVRDCISGIIETDENLFPIIKKENEKNCLKCQHCLAICPQGAISILDKNPQDSIAVRDFVNADDMLGLIKTRRSCRHFKQENLPQDTLDNLKNMLNWIPTGCNFRGLHFSVVEDINAMDEIRNKINSDLKKLLKFMPVFGPFKSYKSKIMAGEDVIFRNAPHMIIVSADKNAPCKKQDPIIALSYFDIYAQTLGVGTLWCGFADMAVKNNSKILKDMNIPSTHKPAYAMMFGTPSVKYARSTQPDNINFSIIK